MVVTFDSSLCIPPSEILAFRDVTLFCSNHDLLLACDKESQDFYWYWLKKYGAWDYLKDIVEVEKSDGLTVGPHGIFKIDRINCSNYSSVIWFIMCR